MRAVLLSLLICLLGSGGSVAAQGELSYTVQVVAVSDQEQAFTMLRELAVQGFPAYTTRAATAQGDVLRVRVGGFANRAAALLYARTMTELPLLTGEPLPALAENIPAGIMTVVPRLLLQEPVQQLELLAWGDAVAVRSDSDLYTLFGGNTTVQFRADGAWREPDGLVLRLRELVLTGNGWENEPATLRDTFVTSRLDSMAATLGLDMNLMRAAVRETSEGHKAVTVLERFNPFLNLEIGQLLAVCTPVDCESGRLEGVMTELPEETVLLDTLTLPEPLTVVQGNGWTITSDGPWMLQNTPGSERSWRAAVGTPVWSDGERVLALHQDQLLLYEFITR